MQTFTYKYNPPCILETHLISSEVPIKQPHTEARLDMPQKGFFKLRLRYTL